MDTLLANIPGIIIGQSLIKYLKLENYQYGLSDAFDIKSKYTEPENESSKFTTISLSLKFFKSFKHLFGTYLTIILVIVSYLNYIYNIYYYRRRSLEPS